MRLQFLDSIFTRLENFTNLFRRLDPNYPSNLQAILLAVGAAVILGLIVLSSGGGLITAGYVGFLAACFTIFAWAAARELEPDYNTPALLAAVLTIAVMAGVGIASLIPVLAVLVSLRTVTRAVGLPLKLIDWLTLTGLAAISAYEGYLWVALIPTAALFLDGLLPEHDRPRIWIFSVLTLAVTLVVWAVAAPQIPNLPIDNGVIGLLVIIGLLALASAATLPHKLLSVDDRRGKALYPARIQAAILLALVAAVGQTLISGMSGLMVLSPVWAALAAVGLSWLIRRVRDGVKNAR